MPVQPRQNFANPTQSAEARAMAYALFSQIERIAVRL